MLVAPAEPPGRTPRRAMRDPGGLTSASARLSGSEPQLGSDGGLNEGFGHGPSDGVNGLPAGAVSGHDATDPHGGQGIDGRLDDRLEGGPRQMEATDEPG